MKRVALASACLVLFLARSAAAQLAAEPVSRFSAQTNPSATAVKLAAPPLPEITDRGDPWLMFAGGAVGGTLGYLVGWGASLGVISTLEAQGTETEPLLPYLGALPALGSALGVATATSRASCRRFTLAGLAPLNSCTDGGLALLATLPGAVLQYFLPKTNLAAVAASIGVEAAGAALAGTIARRPAGPIW